MRNAKKTLSLVMIAIFTTFIVLSGIPAGAVTTAQAKAQVTKATAAVVKVEKTVKVANFNVTTAQTQLTAATKEVAKVKSLGKTYTKTYTALNLRNANVNKKIAARKLAIANAARALAKLFTDADKAVAEAEKATDADVVDLVTDEAALANAQGAVTAALEFIVKLDKNSSNYKGLMARVDSANNLIVKAMDEKAAIEAAAAEAKAAEEAAKVAAEKEAAAKTAAETAVAAVEKAPLVTAADATAAKELSKTAATAVAAVKEADKATFTARLKVMDDKVVALEAALKAKADADLDAAKPATITATAAEEAITVTFSKATAAPVAADFEVMKTIGTAAATTVTGITLVSVSDTVATLKVPATTASETEQSVVFAVAYKGQAAVSTAAYKVAPVSVTVAAIDTKKIEVKFDRAVTPANVTVQLKLGTAIQYTTATFAADNKSVVLEAPVAIAPEAYTVVVTGLVAAPIIAPITIVAATAKTIEITSTQITTGTDTPFTFVVKNQYGTDMGILGNNASISVTAYDVTANKDVALATKSAEKSKIGLNLSPIETYKIGDDIRIMMSYAGLTISKTIKVTAVAAPAEITLGAVAPLTNKTRITVNEEGLKLPYTLKDQYGTDMFYTAGGGVTFVSSKTSVVDPATFNVDATTGVITFKAGATAGTATITAIINATGKVATTTVVVAGTPALKSVTIASPTALVAAEDDAFSLVITGVDQFGAASTDFSEAKVSVASTPVVADAVVAAGAIIGGKLQVTPLAAGSAVISLVNKSDSTVVYGTVTVKVEAKALATAITGLVAGTPITYEVGASKSITYAKFTAKDQYGRAYTLEQADVTAAKVDSANTVFAVTQSALGFDVVAGSAAGTQAVKLTLTRNAASYTVTFVAVASSSIVSYAITNVPTLVYTAGTPGGDYDVALTLGGKLADGTSVVLVAGKVAYATSSSTAVATVTTTGAITGVTKGTSVITLSSATGAELAKATITVSDATPVATTAAIDETTPLTVAVGAKLNVNALLEVYDQYDVQLANTGFWASSDGTVATVSTSGEVTGVKAGTSTITFITGNGIVVKATVTVQ